MPLITVSLTESSLVGVTPPSMQSQSSQFSFRLQSSNFLSQESQPSSFPQEHEHSSQFQQQSSHMAFNPQYTAMQMPLSSPQQQFQQELSHPHQCPLPSTIGWRGWAYSRTLSILDRHHCHHLLIFHLCQASSAKHSTLYPGLLQVQCRVWVHLQLFATASAYLLCLVLRALLLSMLKAEISVKI